MANKTITFENVRIVFRNFSGKEGKYNALGNRNFAVLLTPQEAEQLSVDGFNVKFLKPRDDQDEPQAYMQVKVNFRGRPPKIMMVTSKGKTPLDEDSVTILDWADLKSVDLIINRSEWTMPGGKSGVAAYLKSMYAVLEEDDLDRKYSDTPTTGQDPTFPNEPDEAPF